jgi:hypothetical protein
MSVKDPFFRKKCCIVLLYCFVFLFIVNYDEGIARGLFSLKIILRSPLYNHLSSNVSVIFI